MTAHRKLGHDIQNIGGMKYCLDCGVAIGQ